MEFVPVPDTKVLFFIHETRRQDYAVYAAEVPGVNIEWKNQERDGVPCGDKDNHPVVGVSWEDAQAFCQWLSKKEGQTYRLATDREWSLAVGIGHEEKWTIGVTPASLNFKVQNAFLWGGDFPPKTEDKAGNYADTAYREKFPTKSFIEGYTDGFATTAPAMSFNPNKLGLYDMGGNVWEWCENWYDAEEKDRVLRGGSSYSNFKRHSLLSSCRNRNAPNPRRNDGGFRIVVELTKPER